MNNKTKTVIKLTTGIKGFDEMLEGGVPRGRILTVSGSVGTGKTVLLNEFLYRGVTDYGQNGVFVTFEETPSDIVRNVGNFDWDYPTLIKENKLAFVDLTPVHDDMEEISKEYDPSPILLRIKQAIQKTKAERVVIDSIASLFSQFNNQGVVRKIIYKLCHELKEMGITGMMTVEQSDVGSSVLGYNVEEFVTDGVIRMRIIPGEQNLVREMCIIKMRGVGYRSGSVQFIITPEGLQVFPKIEVTPGTARTDFSVKLRLGIPGLDKALDGGIPQGHIVLVSGNTGAGKTLLCMQFIEEGIKNGEKCLYVALEEPAQQLKKTAETHGWKFHDHEKEGKLVFISANLIDTVPDKLLSDIVETIEQIGAHRIVVDSISSIMSASLHQEKVRQFWLQLASYLKAHGITCILNYLMAANFGAEKGQLLGTLETNSMRLSSVTDGIILLQYVEREQRVEKLLNVLKMRGCNHSREIIKYEIVTGGLQIGEKFGS